MVKPCDTFTKRGQDGRNNGTSPYSITPKLRPPMFHHRRWASVAIGLLVVLGSCGALLSSCRETARNSLSLDFQTTAGCLLPKYIKLENTSITSVHTKGLSIVDVHGSYNLPDRWLPPGSAFVIWSSSGTDDTVNLYASRSTSYWNRDVRLLQDGSMLSGLSETCSF
jgi:hypothetical protein